MPLDLSQDIFLYYTYIMSILCVINNIDPYPINLINKLEKFDLIFSFLDGV